MESATLVLYNYPKNNGSPEFELPDPVPVVVRVQIWYDVSSLERDNNIHPI